MHKCELYARQIYRCTNDNRKENLKRSENKRREENTLCRERENPTDQQYEKLNLEQREILPRFQSWESERFLTGFETREQPYHGSVFAPMLLRGFSLPLTSPTFFLALNSMWRRKARHCHYLS